MSQDDIIFDRALKECEPGVDPEFAATIDCLKAQPCFALVSSMDTSIDNRAVRTHTSRASFQENTPSMVTTGGALSSMPCLAASLWRRVPGWRGTRSHSGRSLSSQQAWQDFSSGKGARSDRFGLGPPYCLVWRVLRGPSLRWFRSARLRLSRTTNKWGRFSQPF